MTKPRIVKLSSKDPTDTALEGHLRKYYNLVRDMRGSFLEQSIWIDHILSELLAEYFCDNDKIRPLFFSEVIGGADFRFSSRITLLGSIMKAYHPQLAPKQKSLCDRLDKVRRFRNRLAHSHVKADPEDIARAQDDKFTLVFYEDGMSKEYIASAEDFRVRIKEATDLFIELLEIKELMLKEKGE